MRTTKLAAAVVLAAAALSANAAQNRLEPINSPFTWEVLGATPTLTFGRAQPAAPQPAAPQAAAPSATVATKTAAKPASRPIDRTTGAATTPFTYEVLGATPHVELRKPQAAPDAAAATR